ncbi:aminotransferase [Aaosphaeria arxii CBS 175.79]|uniref:Aminotransferase n=1 Tax=Aaosphaeria arxii CBS 175.79 TaxID=1450172 RepID=A0A6A5XFF1_9PLEO|nr:aminotransferase [Aaosphaeria arxii CBS 175.79]KAF2011589.1 aminotransferase [Aaosphaeria arxii CBS 175.79]
MSKNINLQLGWPSPSLFPSSHLLDGASNVLNSSKKTAAALVYGPDAGYDPLRESIAKWLGSFYLPSGGISSERICVTNGASANLGNVLARFTEPGYTRNIWMIEPCYFLACPIFMDHGFQGLLKGVPEDEEGLDIEYLRRSLEASEKEASQQSPNIKTGDRYAKMYKHIIYGTPTFSNPSGKTMSLRRREALVRLAREYDALVITDDVYDVLRWPADEHTSSAHLGTPPPRIVDLDRTLDRGPKDEWGNAMSNGSFSKIIAPGVRVGWAEASPALTLALSTLGSNRSGGCPTQLTASFVHELLETGTLENHLTDLIIPTYRTRYHAMMKAIGEYLIPLGFAISVGRAYEESLLTYKGGTNGYTNGHTNGYTNGDANGHTKSIAVAGGYFTYLTLPDDVSSRGAELAAIALSNLHLRFAYGDMMQVNGDDGSIERGKEGYGKGIRLCWAWHPEDEIVEGIQRIAGLIQLIRS